MLQVFIGAALQEIDLGQISISFILKSPIFNSEDGSGTYPFSVPATDRNKKIFQFPHRLTRNSNTTFSDVCLIKFSGVEIFSGIIKTKQTTENTSTGECVFECAVGIGKGDLYNNIKNKTLQDIDYGDSPFSNFEDAYTHYNASVTSQYPDYSYVVAPFKDYIFLDGADSSFDDDFKNNIRYLNHYYLGDFFTAWHNKPKRIIPFLYLNFVLDKLFSTFNYKIKTSKLQNDAELNTLVLFNLYVATFIWYDLTGSKSYGSSLNFKNHVPAIAINDFLNGLRDLFNLSIFINNKTKNVDIILNKDILNSTETIDFTENVNNLQTLEDDIDGYDLNYEKDSADAITEQIYEDIDLNNYTYKGGVSDYSLLPPSGNSLYDLYHVVDEDAWYYWFINTLTGDGEWKFLSIDLLPVKDLQNNNLEKKSIISTPFNVVEDDFILETYADPTVYRQWLIPNVMQPGSDEGIKSDSGFFKNDFASRLLFYRGMQKDSLNSDYPLCTHHIYDYGLNQVGNYSLKWTGANGLYEKFWKEWLRWYCSPQRKPIRINKMLSLKEIQILDFSKKHRITEDTNALLNTVKFTLTNDAISVAEIDAYTC